MKRTKKHITALIPAFPDDDARLIFGAAADAYRYADDIYVGIALPAHQGLRDEAFTVLERRLARDYGAKILVSLTAFDDPRFRRNIHNSFGAASDRPRAVVYSEVGWRISEPDSVRDVIEYNDGVISAVRFFQWDDTHFRIDHQYRPTRIPLVGEYRHDAHWEDPMTSAPAWMWAQRTRWVEAPFHVVDETFTYDKYRPEDPREPSLSLITEKVFS